MQFSIPEVTLRDVQYAATCGKFNIELFDTRYFTGDKTVKLMVVMGLKVGIEHGECAVYQLVAKQRRDKEVWVSTSLVYIIHR
jgi:hypothetical protein